MRFLAITKQRGFTIIEMMFSLVIAMFVLVAMVQLMVRSSSMFVRVKDRSDRLIDKAIIKEQVDFYMERWGQGVAENATAVAGAYPPDSRFNYVLHTNQAYSTAGAVVANPQFDSFEFMGNLEGYAVVHNISGSKANLVSCRLQSAVNNQSSGCYTILREGDYWEPEEVDTNLSGALALLSLSPQDDLDFDKRTFSYARLDGFSRLPNTQECIDQSNYVPNAEINKTLTYKNGKAVSIATGSNSYELHQGDFIQPLPQKVKFLVRNNPEDQRRYWLYIESAPISDCPEAPAAVPEPVAPVRQFKVDDSTAGRIRMDLSLGYDTADKPNQSNVETLLSLEYYYGS